MTAGLILKRAPIGWNPDDFDVLEKGKIVGRIFKVPIAPQDRHNVFESITPRAGGARIMATWHCVCSLWLRQSKPPRPVT